MSSIKKVAVIGAGMMGAEIALSFALNGSTVLLKDIKLEYAESGKKRVEGILAKWTEKGKMEKEKPDRRTFMGDLLCDFYLSRRSFLKTSAATGAAERDASV